MFYSHGAAYTDVCYPSSALSRHSKGRGFGFGCVCVTSTVCRFTRGDKSDSGPLRYQRDVNPQVTTQAASGI